MQQLDGQRLLIVGNSDPVHVGAHLLRAAQGLELCVALCDSRRAYTGPWAVRKFHWWLRGRRPSRLRAFSREVVETARSFLPDWVLTTGISPLDADALQALGDMGIRRINFLTDDPWNRHHRTSWFLDALRQYDQVFSPRYSNLEDLTLAGCRQIDYLPFAYDPELHYPETNLAAGPDPFACDVMFAGGADRERVPYLVALIRAGFDVALYGGYWDRYAVTRPCARGFLDGPALRQAVRGARVVLCLVRRANRDGHVMRTFEVPAMGGCMLTEHTEEHEEILGPDGEAVVYFRTPAEMVEGLRRLLGNDGERRRLAQQARHRIAGGPNTYQDRLQTLLGAGNGKVAIAPLPEGNHRLLPALVPTASEGELWPMPWRIALVVHGRFHGFDLARELLKRGHDVVLYTNYPRFVAERFGIPRERVCTFLAHGVGSRGLWKLFPGGLGGNVERLTNSVFGWWAAREVARERWDVVIAFSGVAEEVFQAVPPETLKVLQRGSAHIRVQRQLLDEEVRRAGCPLDKPSDWIIAREEREYELADAIHVLSGFAHCSFVEQRVPPEKLFILSLGVNSRHFTAPAEVLEARCRRIQSGEPLRVLNVGTFCCRKGALDFVDVVQRVGTQRFAFRFVGPVSWDARAIQKRLVGVEFMGKRPQAQLPHEYAWGDLFVLPTIEDGFAVVLTQSLAAGLPVLVTPNCAGPELVREGETGWVVPARQPEAIAERLLWCDGHRDELARMVRQTQAAWQPPDWAETARQAEQNIGRALALKRGMAKTETNATVVGVS